MVNSISQMRLIYMRYNTSPIIHKKSIYMYVYSQWPETAPFMPSLQAAPEINLVMLCWNYLRKHTIIFEFFQQFLNTELLQVTDIFPQARQEFVFPA